LKTVEAHLKVSRRLQLLQIPLDVQKQAVFIAPLRLFYQLLEALERVSLSVVK